MQLTVPDLKSLKDWLVSLVDAVDDLPDGKTNAAVPRYVPPVVEYAGETAPYPPAGRGWSHDHLTPNGASAA